MTTEEEQNIIDFKMQCIKAIKDRLAPLIADGYTQAELAKKLNVAQPRISVILKNENKAVRDHSVEKLLNILLHTMPKSKAKIRLVVPKIGKMKVIKGK